MTDATDWLAWHEAYDDPTSSLSRRLAVVRRHLGEVLDALSGAGPVRLLSLCAGDGRDVIDVLHRRASASDTEMGAAVSAVLVEQYPELCRHAMAAVIANELAHVEVRCADAGDPASFADVLPVDVLLLCGIFGNIAHREVRHVIEAVPSMLHPGGSVIWTRGGSLPDRRPEIRTWFRAAGFDELTFEGEPEPFGVGVHRLVRDHSDQRRPLPDVLFTFSS